MQAEQIIRARLAVRETPELLCALGEVTRDESCLLKAWELSGRRHARAMTALAFTCLNRGLVRLPYTSDSRVPYFHSTLQLLYTCTMHSSHQTTRRTRHCTRQLVAHLLIHVLVLSR